MPETDESIRAESITPVLPAEGPRSSSLSARLRRELWWILGALIFGLAVLPMLIYASGKAALGNYGGGPHLWAFLGDLYRSLGAASVAAWSIVLGPTVLIMLLRLIFASSPKIKAAPPEPQASELTPRREPFIGG
ncbi:MAG: hypothetical protein H7Y02_09685 [Candidatus Obscuribacterales bacterium]|nr:hypothetical protein [Steroidobacteraceae bacterium]